ncbi:MAG: hypothetical protein JRJ51_24150 [Deltaproteobacteria bacterium]|nr:hypothetical protein [Deltaproteobacteria bacterium]
MPAAKPQKIEILFEDGSRVEEDFELLPTPLQRDLLRQPFATRPSPHPEQEKYLLLEWEDGWKEVMQVDPACTEINRYYVISRPEDMGRLSLNREDGYPDLIEVIRKPLYLRRITFIDNFHLSPTRSDREGNKTDHFFKMSNKGETFASEIVAFKKILADEKIDPKELQTEDPTLQKERFERIRQLMGLRAAFRQQDVFDFIAYLARSLSDS